VPSRADRENDLIAPPTGAATNPSTKTQIKALATSSPTLSTASAITGSHAGSFNHLGAKEL
jgi:hypothetical protein